MMHSMLGKPSMHMYTTMYRSVQLCKQFLKTTMPIPVGTEFFCLQQNWSNRTAKKHGHSAPVTMLAGYSQVFNRQCIKKTQQ